MELAASRTNDSSERIAYYDHLKFVLICLVVIAHGFANHIGENANLPSLFVFINSFHMPLFIYVSGLFYRNENVADRVTLLITYALYFKVLGWIIGTLTGHTWMGFSLFKETTMPWFLFALAAWEGFTYMLRKVNPKFVLMAGVIIGCLAGYDTMVTGSEFLSRLVVWYPFFYLGVVTDREKLVTFIKTKKPTRLTFLKGICMILMFTYAVICVVCRTDIWKLASLIIPQTLFSDMPFSANIFTRLLYYMGVIVVGIGFMAVIPTKIYQGGVFRTWGRRTLQVYMYHIFIRNIFDKNGWASYLCSSNLGILLYIVFNILLVIVLSQKVFSIPTDYIKKNIFVKD